VTCCRLFCPKENASLLAPLAGCEPNVRLFAVRWHPKGQDQWSQIHSGQSDYAMNTIYKLFILLGYQNVLQTMSCHQSQQMNGNKVKRQVGKHQGRWLMEI